MEIKRVIVGQILLIICCYFYLIWWYRGYRPGTDVSRAFGVNGILLMITAAFGMLGLMLSLMPVKYEKSPRITGMVIIVAGIIAYFLLMFVTKVLFDRIVTTELFLIVGWTMLETTVISRLAATGVLNNAGFVIMCLVIATAFVISMVLYVAYYRMEEMKAFYAAMVPLVTEGLSMAVLVLIICISGGKR